MSTAAANPTPGTILLAPDLSARCARALDRAVQLARQWQARLVAVAVGVRIGRRVVVELGGAGSSGVIDGGASGTWVLVHGHQGTWTSAGSLAVRRERRVGRRPQCEIGEMVS